MCEICTEISGVGHRDLLVELLGGNPGSWVLFESSHFAVLPSVGPLVAGHVLICPRRHTNRLASVYLDEVGDLKRTKATVANVLEAVFGSPVQFFEHGASVDGQYVPCTVTHAHLHALPVRPIWPELPTSLTWDAVSSTPTALARHVGDNEYLYYEGSDGNAVVATKVGLRIESQLLRRVIAEQLGHPTEWNWREYPRTELLRRTCEALAPAFSSWSMSSVAR